MIASHYAEPLERQLARPATLLDAPSDSGTRIAELEAGSTIRILERRSGWAWGYAGERVGYVPSNALTA